MAVYVALSYFDMSFWWILLALVPISYVQIYLTNRYNFRDSVKMEPVPHAGYEDRIAGLNANQAALAQFGFAKIDEFYMPISPDVLVYAYRHDPHPITLVDYNMQMMSFCDMVTQFDGDSILTTSNSGNAGVTPIPDNAFLQVFPETGYPAVLRAHLNALEFLKEKGFRPRMIQSENYRPEFMKYYHMAGDYAKGILSPVKLIYRMATGQKKRYFRSIQEQHLAKLIRLP